MSDHDDDIRWLSDRQPEIEFPEPEVSGNARAAVMAHATHSPRLAAVVAAPSAERPRRRRIGVFSRPRRAITMAAAVAVVAVAGYAATLAVGPSSHDSAIGPAVANAEPLVLLADTVAATPRTGDATLIFHRNAIQGEGTFTGADLYLDNGLYFYADTPSGLTAAVESGPQDYSIKPILDAMAAPASADAQAARAAFLKAADPLYGGDVQHESAARQDNVIWVAGMDVLGAAYGRPAVLAGTLRALSTVHGVSVTHGSLSGVKTLVIAMKVPVTASEKGSFAADTMRATVDARTGALLRYTDIGLVVTYHVSRVDAGRYGVR